MDYPETLLVYPLCGRGYFALGIGNDEDDVIVEEYSIDELASCFEDMDILDSYNYLIFATTIADDKLDKAINYLLARNRNLVNVDIINKSLQSLNILNDITNLQHLYYYNISVNDMKTLKYNNDLKYLNVCNSKRYNIRDYIHGMKFDTLQCNQDEYLKP